MRRRKAGAGSMVTTSCPSSFKASGSPTGSKLPRTRRPRNPKPPPPEPSGHHQNSAIALCLFLIAVPVLFLLTLPAYAEEPGTSTPGHPDLIIVRRFTAPIRIVALDASLGF